MWCNMCLMSIWLQLRERWHMPGYLSVWTRSTKDATHAIIRHIPCCYMLSCSTIVAASSLQSCSPYSQADLSLEA